MKKLSIIPFLLLTSCGYQLSYEENPYHLTSISVPYVKGDIDGRLTSALIRHIGTSTPYEYTAGDGQLELRAAILASDFEYIGFQYDRDETTGELINRLTPNEERKNIEIEVSLVDTHTGEVLLGPSIIKTSVDYDYVDSDSIQDVAFFDSGGRRTSVLEFSLGQLNAFEDAREGALTPLYEKLAEKITSGINNIR